MKKKIWITIGTTISATLPVAMAVSCGRDLEYIPKNLGPKDPNINYINPGLSSHEMTKKNIDLSPVLNFINSHSSEYPHLTREIVNSISLSDLHNLKQNNFSSLSQAKILAFKEFKDMMLKFSFDNNDNVNAMRELVEYYNENAMSIYSIPRETIGSFRKDLSVGEILYYRQDLFTPRYSSNGSRELSLFNSDSTSSNHKFYNTISKNPNIIIGNRSFTDWSTSASISPNTMEEKATSFNVVHDVITGQYKKSNGTWTSLMNRSIELTNGFSIKVNSHTYTNLNDPNLTRDLNNNEEMEIAYNGMASYQKTTGPSMHHLRGKDLFLGFIRKLYSFKTVRENGTLNNQLLHIPKFSNSEIIKLKQEFGADTSGNFGSNINGKSNYELYNNLNSSLYNLYNIDINATIDANLSNRDNSKFIIKTTPGKKLNHEIILLLKDTNIITPVPISFLNNSSLTGGEYSGFFNVGQFISAGSGKVNVLNNLSLAPYMYTQVDYSRFGKTNLSINASSPYFNNVINNKITNVELEQSDPYADPSSKATSELSKFKDGTSGQVLMNKGSINQRAISELSSYQHVYKVLNNFPKNEKFTWNFYMGASDKNQLNYFGRKMLYGLGGINDVKNANYKALSHFYSGDGAIVRMAIGSSVNWYKNAQMNFPNKNLDFFGSIIQEDTMIGNSKIESFGPSSSNTFLKPTWLDDYSSLKEQYITNTDEEIQWETPSIQNAALTIDNLAKKYGASLGEPAVIPIPQYEFSDIKESDGSTIASDSVINILNKLSPRVKFVKEVSTSFSVWIQRLSDGISIESSNTFTPDYDGVGSIMSLAMTGGNLSGWGLIIDSFNQ